MCRTKYSAVCYSVDGIGGEEEGRVGVVVGGRVQPCLPFAGRGDWIGGLNESLARHVYRFH